jgi:hypothetical protein
MRALLIAIAVCGCVHAAQTPRMHLDRDEQARVAVAIDVWCGDGYPSAKRLFASSGAIVSSRHVITARHVVDACPGVIPSLHVVLANGERYRVVWYAYLRGDAALLQRADAGSWSWAKRPIVTGPGPHATVCAETVNPVRKRICGPVTSLYERAHVRYRATTVGGNSGAAVWDRFGNLIGVHNAHEDDGPSAFLQRLDPAVMP